MRVADGRETAQRWVEAEGPALPGFAGAFTHGSLNWLPDSAEMDPSSDVDLVVLLDTPEPPEKIGKFLHRRVLLDVSFLPVERLEAAERVLADYHLAGSFSRASILADPHGRLAGLKVAVAGQYAQGRWVQARCRDAEANILRHLQKLDDSHFLHEEVIALLFAAGVTTHVLLVAGLRNPTVRTRYAAVRELLGDCGLSPFYPELLQLLGWSDLDRRRAERHLEAMVEAFDRAKRLIRTHFPFAADLSDASREVAVAGSRALIDRGLHREAMFWIAVTLSRCQQVFFRNAPAEVDHFRPAFGRLLEDLGAASPAMLRERAAAIRAFLPRLRVMAERVMEATAGGV